MNRDAYNAIVEAWDAARSALNEPERRYLDAFLYGLPAESHILDLGCGTGRPIAETVLTRGHRVTGVDQAQNLLVLARARFPQAAWIESRIEDFDSPVRFGGIICWDALFHIDRAEHAGLFQRMATLLVAGGRLMLTVGGSEHPSFTDTMFGHEFFYDSHPPGKVLELLAARGFVPLIADFINEPTGGRDKGRYAIVATLGS
jgi:cyclopropane fatty-acyl-phospholipid synthase-like methyltransferase